MLQLGQVGDVLFYPTKCNTSAGAGRPSSLT